MNTKATKFLAVLAVLAMAFAVIVAFVPAEQNDAVDDEASTVDSYEELVAAITEDDFDVVLGENITLEGTLSIVKSGTIDMGGHNISATDMRAIWVKDGTLTITGEGTVSVTASEGTTFSKGSSVIRVGPADAAETTAALVVDKDVTVTTDYCYGISVFGMASTSQFLDLKGTVSVTGGVPAIANNGTDSLKNTSITIEEDATVLAGEKSAMAIYHPGSGELTVNGTVIGYNGGIEMKAGTLSIGAKASISVSENAVTSHNPYSNGPSTSGYALALVQNNDYKGSPTVTINGGTIDGPIATLTDSEKDGSTTSIIIDADFELKDYLVAEDPSTEITVNDGKTLTIGEGAELTVKEGAKLTNNGAITGDGAIWLSGTLTGGTYNEVTCYVSVFAGATWTGYASTDGNAIITIAEESSLLLVPEIIFHQVEADGAITAVYYTIYGDITLNNGSWLDNDYEDVVEIYGTVTIADNLTIEDDDDVCFADDGAGAILESGKSITGKITHNIGAMELATATFDALTAGEGKIIIVAGSIELSGAITSGTISAGEDVIIGDAEITALTIEKGATVMINGMIEAEKDAITNSGTVVIGEDAVVDLDVISGGVIEYEIAIDENIENGTVTVDPTSSVAGKVISVKVIPSPGYKLESLYFEGAESGKVDIKDYKFTMVDEPVVVYATFIDSEETGIEGTLDADFTINTSAYLSNDLTIPAGITLYVNGELKMNNFHLYVEGDLVIGKKGTISSTSDDGKIVLSRTGEITNDGIIGNGSLIWIYMEDDTSTYTTSGLVFMQDVSGIKFSVTKVVDRSLTIPTQYYLTVSGDAAIVKGSSDYGFMAIGALIGDLNLKDIAKIEDEPRVYLGECELIKGATLTIGSKTVAVMNISMQSGSVLDIYGTIIDGKYEDEDYPSVIHLMEGATVNINGDVFGAEFCAYVGEYLTYNDETKERNDPEKVLKDEAEIYIGNLKGITLTVTSKTYTKSASSETKYTEQIFSMSGDAALIDTTAASGYVTVNGVSVVSNVVKVYVLAGTELNLPKGASIDADNANIETLGLLTGNDLELANYIGAMYEITVLIGTDEYTTTYYTTFDDAYPNLSICDDYTINVRGGYEFTGIYTINDDQTIYFANEDVAGAEYVIDSDAVFTVKDGGVAAIYGTKIAGFTEINGYLIVEAGGICIPVEGTYQVSSVDEDKTITYAGLVRALADADEGDVVVLTQDATVRKLLTVPSLVTLKISEGVTLTAIKGLTVNGILVNEDTVIVTGGDLTVNGVFDNTEGTTNVTEEILTGKKYNATITGLLTTAPAKFDVAGDVNAATFNDGVYDYYTTPANAANLVALMDVPVNIMVTGEVTDSNAVTLVYGVNMIVKGTLKVPSITVLAGSTLTVDGKLTTAVVGDIGSILGIVPEIDVIAIEDVVFTTTYAESTAKYTTYMTGFTAGTAIIEQGSVTIAADVTMVFSDSLIFGVEAGAELITTGKIDFSEVSDTDDTYFYMEGTWIIKGDGSTLKYLEIDGTTEVTVNVKVVLEGVVITGDFVLAEATTTYPAAKATVKGYLVIGTPLTDLGDDASITGTISFDTGAYALVCGESTFLTDDEDVVDTAFVINGELFVTVYGYKTTTLNDAIGDINTAVEALEDAGYVIPNPIEWKSGSDVVSETTNTNIGKYAMVTLTLTYANVAITYTPEPGTILYIDGVKVDAETATISVGIHTVAVYLELGYQGDLTVKFNGKTLPVTASGITLDITPEMQLTTNVLVVSGAEPIPEPEPVTPEEKSEWTVTTILLVILVILIAIMAVIVALRLNRS